MQNLQITKSGYFIALFMVVMLLPVNGFSAPQQADNWLDEPVTIRFQNEPLSTVLEKISKQTGIATLYDQELANEKVSGNYKDVKASDAITRLFSGKNKSIQVSKDKKVIVVKTFGAKDFIWAGTSKGQDSSSKITLAELEKLHAQQYKEYKERIANDNEVLEGDMTRSEIHALHKKQYEEYQTNLQNDNEVLEGGMTRNEVRTLHKKQYEEYQASLQNDNEVLEGGMIRSEVRTMQKKQHEEYQASLQNDNEILEGGMIRSEVRTMQKKQYANYKEKQKDKSRFAEQ